MTPSNHYYIYSLIKLWNIRNITSLLQSGYLRISLFGSGPFGCYFYCLILATFVLRCLYALPAFLLFCVFLWSVKVYYCLNLLLLLLLLYFASIFNFLFLIFYICATNIILLFSHYGMSLYLFLCVSYISFIFDFFFFSYNVRRFSELLFLSVVILVLNFYVCHQPNIVKSEQKIIQTYKYLAYYMPKHLVNTCLHT